MDKHGNPISNRTIKLKTIGIKARYAGTTLPLNTRGVEFYNIKICANAYPLYGDCSSTPETTVTTEYYGATANAFFGDTAGTKYTIEATDLSSSLAAYYELFTTGFRAADNYIPPGIYLRQMMPMNDQGQTITASKAGTLLKAPLMAEFILMRDDIRLEGPTACSSGQGLCWNLVSTGKVLTEKITKGTVTFAAVSGDGTAGTTKNIGDGKYQATYTTGPQPSSNMVEAAGSATINVPKVLYNPMVTGTVMPSFGADYFGETKALAITEYSEASLICANGTCKLPTADVTLNGGQQAVFYSGQEPLAAGNELKATYTIYGVLTEITGTDPAVIFLDNEGYSLNDTKIKYTVKPPEYNAIIADIDIFEREPGSVNADNDIWKYWLPGSATQGDGTATLFRGTKFDKTKEYYAQVVLNKGSEAEVRGEKQKLPIMRAMIDIAVDGNVDAPKDDMIEFNNPADTSLLFWLNDDGDKYTLEGEDDTQPLPAGTDSDDQVIESLRDLEDFARVHLKVDESLLSIPEVAFYLTFRNIVTSSKPSINLFEAIGADSSYLRDKNYGTVQIAKQALMTIGSTEVKLDKSHIKPDGAVSPFIFEGKTEGKGELTFIAKLNGVTLQEKSVLLDLKPITTFYDKYLVNLSGQGIDGVNSGIDMSSIGTYKPFVDDYILYVHGWNMSGEWVKERWAETMLKRLWWQGYKGRVGLFSWPELGLSSYDRSELRAWNSAEALKSLLNDLNNKYSGKVRVLAHSQGNIVASEAIRLATPHIVQTYIATQAAISAHMYDTSDSLKNDITEYSTPDVYGHYPVGEKAYFEDDGQGFAIQSKTKLVSYFNRDDFALVTGTYGFTTWEKDNELKPDTTFGYHYSGDVEHYDPESDRFYWQNVDWPYNSRTLYFPADRYEIFARIAQSRSTALGAALMPANGIFANQRDLHELLGYDKKHYSHSRQFRSNVIDEWNYWEAVMMDIGLTPLPKQ